MTLACLLAIAILLREEPLPTPVVAKPVARFEKSGQPALDTFARRVIDAVRNADWDSFTGLSGKTVTFETCEQGHDGHHSSSDVFFDDEPIAVGNPVFAYTCQRLVVDTSAPPTPFVTHQFAYFASLVDECVAGKTSSAQCRPSMLRADRGSRVPTIWGSVATNATWRIELAQSGKKWRVSRLVVEDH